jgi:hypothetical protein
MFLKLLPQSFTGIIAGGIITLAFWAGLLFVVLYELRHFQLI